MTIASRIEEATRSAILRASGRLQVTFRRDAGVAPNVTTVEATVTALVRGYQLNGQEAAQEGFSTSSGGAITQGDRQIFVMAADLMAAGFPLPLMKGDRVLIETGETLVLSSVDALKRAIAGCIEATGTGV